MPAFGPLLEHLASELPTIPGLGASGLYVYGSALGDEFVPDRSDLDLILTTEGAIDDAALARLDAWLSDTENDHPSLERVQMTIVVRDRALEDDPAACLYQFGRLTRSGSDGNPIIWLDLLRRGRALFGPDPRGFLPPITAEILHAALVRELGYLRQELALGDDGEWARMDSYRAYAVLTLCRILYTHATGDVIGKATAAEWAVRRVPDRFHPLIREAARSSAGEAVEVPPAETIEPFLQYVDETLERNAP